MAEFGSCRSPGQPVGVEQWFDGYQYNAASAGVSVVGADSAQVTLEVLRLDGTPVDDVSDVGGRYLGEQVGSRGSQWLALPVASTDRILVRDGYGGWRYAEAIMERATRATAQVPAVPDDLDTTEAEKATGVVELPLHIRWSGPPRRYDLADRQQRARVYEQVLREGNEDDVRRFIRTDDLIDLWDELVLPRNVRHAWTDWLQRHRRVTLS